jgi:hypothetical protein
VTKKELVEALKNCPDDVEVYYYNDEYDKADIITTVSETEARVWTPVGMKTKPTWLIR